ncbi:MAG TPA: NAD-dependent epimerase/dehydratase family protein [Anaerolineae bacterium]
MSNVLVTGGAGFIGSHLVDALIAHGHRVRVLDNLVEQVHGPNAVRSAHVHPDAEFIRGDVRDANAIRSALRGVEIVFHEAAEVGVGQSMYEVTRYVGGNTYATSVLLEVLANEKHTVKRLLVASSMSIYGEGAYRCPEHGRIHPFLRSEEQLARKDWEMRCPLCGKSAQWMGTPEDKPLFPTSIYAVSKMDQELMCLAIGRAYNIPTVALRYFNVYGPRQALSNPYTGVAAIFSSRLLNGRPPIVFEDGLQSRDFVHVSDIVQANLLAMERDEAAFEVFNIGTGRPLSILDVALALSRELKVDIAPQIVGGFRAGDIRHCVADISKARKMLEYEPRVKFEEGLAELVAWVKSQHADDYVERARSELEARGLIRA